MFAATHLIFITPVLRPPPASPEHVTEDFDSSKRAGAGYDVWIFSRQPILSSTATKTNETARCGAAMERPPVTGYLIFAERARSIVKTMKDRDNI
jgi:hypothetical protein